MEPKILYEDNHLIAVFKEAGVLVQGDSSGHKNLLDEVRRHIKEKYKKPGNVFVGLLHRLDRPVSGIVLFAKTSKGAARLSEQFRNQEVKKSYHAVVVGKINSPRGYLRDYIKKNEAHKKAIISDMPEDGFDEAELWYETVSINDRFSLLKIEIKSGKFHQIRAQLAHSGYPIAGDIKYGAEEPLPEGQIALCATDLAFKTATGEDTKAIKVDYPEEWGEWFGMQI